MHGTVAAVLLVLAGIQSARAQSNVAVPSQGSEAVRFCDLISHPDRYDGRIVQVTAIYASNTEGAIFFDAACKQSPSHPFVVARVTYSAGGHDASAEFEKLSRTMKTYRSAEARVTVIAIFSEEDVLAGCCRYKLNVKHIVAVEKVKPPIGTN